jgi:hypothetical protein
LVLAVKAIHYVALGVIFALRFAAIVLPGNLLQTDPDGYLRLANALVDSGVYGLLNETGLPQATAYRPPLYPLLLAATLWCSGSASLWAIAALHASLATCSAALLLNIARILQLRWALIACLLFSLDPLLIRQSQLIMTETAATTLGLFSWWLLLAQERSGQPSTTSSHGPSSRSTRSKWVLSILVGFSFGIATLTRPTAAVWLVFWVVYDLIRASLLHKVSIQTTSQNTSQHTVQKAFQRTAWQLIGFAFVLTPWIARNQEYFGKPIWATTHGGYTLLLANNPILYDHFATGSVSRDWDEDQFHRWWHERRTIDRTRPDYTQHHREVLEDQFAQSLAIETMQTRPWMFAWSSLIRIGWLWTPLPNPRPDSWIKWPIATWYLALYSLALLGAWTLGPKNWSSPWIGWLLLISLTLVHSIYWSNMRMRAPALPLLYLLAAQFAETQIPFFRRLMQPYTPQMK